MAKGLTRSKNRVLVGLAVAILLPTALYLARRPLLFAIGDFLVVRDELSPADVIHVISGPNERVDYGIELYLQGYGKRLFFTGTGYQARQAQQRAVRRGVPESAVFYDSSHVTSTYSEAIRLRKFIAQSEVPVHSVILVSDPYHMRRARWAYRHEMGRQVDFQAAPLPFELSRYRHQWWTHKRSLEMVGSEYIKMVYYRVTYGLTWGPVREWLVSLDRG